MLLLVSMQATAGKLYKWVDKDGTVHYTQTSPPEAAAADDAEELNISTATIRPTKKRGRYYCGRDELPRLSGTTAVDISNLQNKIYDWEEAMERRETERSGYVKRRYYNVENYNDALRRYNQDNSEDRCKVAWAKKQLGMLQGDKKKIVARYDDIKSAIEELEGRKLRECGKDERTGFIVVDEEYREYMQCNKRFDDELRRLKRELKKAERDRDLVTPD